MQYLNEHMYNSGLLLYRSGLIFIDYKKISYEDLQHPYHLYVKQRNESKNITSGNYTSASADVATLLKCNPAIFH